MDEPLAISGFPALAALMPFTVVSGYEAAPGVPWLNAQVAYDVETCDNVDDVIKKRVEALSRLAALLNEDLQTQKGPVKLYVLKGWWLKETKLPSTIPLKAHRVTLAQNDCERRIPVAIDCCYAFVPKDC